MEFVCVVASHLSSSFRVEFLKQTLLSALFGLKAERIIVSCSGLLPTIPEDERITILHHSEKKSQFSHIQSVLHLIQPKDTVVFIDDDDMFLPKSRKILESIIETGMQCGEGFSFLSVESDHKINSYGWEQICQMEEIKEDEYLFQLDFPGTFCSGEKLFEYFSQGVRRLCWEESEKMDDEYLPGEEDCVFMQYFINPVSKSNKTFGPWVFHREHMLQRDY